MKTYEGFVAPSETFWNDVQAAWTLAKPILLKGPTGSGKTKLAEALARTHGRPIESVNSSVDLDAESLLGFKTLVARDGESVIEFVDGPVVRAMKEGHLLYIDEINMARPETLPILHGVLDYRRTLTNPFTGEVIVAHPEFRVIAAINEGYVGTTPMNEALKNRFVAYDVPYIDGEALKQLLKQRVPGASEEAQRVAYAFARDVQHEVKEGRLVEQAASIRSLLDALELSQHMPLRRAIEYAVIAKIDEPLERAFLRELVATWCDV